MFQRKYVFNTAKNVTEYALLRKSLWSDTLFTSILGCRRWISNAELSALLRPFYFVVHPDLFGQHPQQRSTNEDSLKHLSAHLEALQSQRISSTSPKFISFYVRDKENARDSFKMIRIALEQKTDVKQFLKHIFKTCNLPTENVEKIQIAPHSSTIKFTSEDRQYGDSSIYDEYEIYAKIKRAKQAKTLKRWLESNIATAKERTEVFQTIRADVNKLEKRLVSKLNLSAIKYDCSWNAEHIRGCLKSLEHLTEMHEDVLMGLCGRTIVLSQSSAVSFDGHVMLSTGDVQHNWLDFIKNIPKQDEYLERIPAYEKALSQVMCGIRVSRRKFMPKAEVIHYAGHLRKITTSMLDYLTQHTKYPKSWPTDLSNFEIVIESEAGPLCVSPTGQFIAPSTCPGSILVDFLSNHMNEAAEKSEEYKRNKHVEKELHTKCLEKFDLLELTKDDSVDPKRMIECLQRLLNTDIDIQITNCVLHITNYYSVLSDGSICIPWDWELE